MISSVQETDSVPLSCRLSLAKSGVLPDSYVHWFASHLTDDDSYGVPPFMKRGTYIRTIGIDNTIRRLLQEITGPVQILVFGAGSDTRWFRSNEIFASSVERYVEVDLPSSISRKQMILKKNGFISDGRYHLFSADLNQKFPLDRLQKETEWNIKIPTIFVTECCQMYLTVAAADALMADLASLCVVEARVIIYEPLFINKSRFTLNMKSNLASWGIQLHFRENISSLADLMEVYKRSAGRWQVDYAHLMYEMENFSDLYLDSASQKVLKNQLSLDEWEEWKLISSHYYICVLSKNNRNSV